MRARTRPGEVLREEFLKPMKTEVDRLAQDLDVPSSLIADIANEKKDVTADIAMRLAQRLGTTAGFWLNLQVSHSLAKATVGNDE